MLPIMGGNKSQHAPSHSKRAKSGGDSSKHYVYEWKWGCCNCASSAGMDAESTTNCPECWHLRCNNCTLESVRRHKFGWEPPSLTYSSAHRSISPPAQTHRNSKISKNKPPESEGLESQDTGEKLLTHSQKLPRYVSCFLGSTTNNCSVSGPLGSVFETVTPISQMHVE
jgi:hypothetical protein